jgi:hypothetical protein
VELVKELGYTNVTDTRIIHCDLVNCVSFVGLVAVANRCVYGSDVKDAAQAKCPPGSNSLI